MSTRPPTASVKQEFIMPATRVYVSDTLTVGNDIELGAERARYIGRVLRKKVGDRIVLFNGRGGEFDASILQIRKDVVAMRVEEFRDADCQSPLEIRLMQCVSRGERMDFVVQKATELGVSRITPVISEFSIVKFDEKRAGKRVLHWQKVSISACEQSGRTRLPVVERPVRLRDGLGESLHADGLRLICKPGAGSSAALPASPNNAVLLLIGPEGGFSDSEYELAEAAGFAPLSLGPRVLRTETAALAAITILQHRLGDMH